jgi:hypothetical protein
MSRAALAPREDAIAADLGSLLRLLAFVNSLLCARNYRGLTRFHSALLDHRI